MSNPLSLPEPGNLETLNIIAECLRYHDQRYFQQDQPEISDEDYDRLRAKFDRLAERFDQAASRYPDLMQRVGAGLGTGHRLDPASHRKARSRKPDGKLAHPQSRGPAKLP